MLTIVINSKLFSRTQNAKLANLQAHSHVGFYCRTTVYCVKTKRGAKRLKGLKSLVIPIVSNDVEAFCHRNFTPAHETMRDHKHEPQRRTETTLPDVQDVADKFR